MAGCLAMRSDVDLSPSFWLGFRCFSLGTGRVHFRLIKQLTQAAYRSADLGLLGPGGAIERSLKRAMRKRGQPLRNKCLDYSCRIDTRDTAIRGIGAPFKQAFRHQPIDDAADCGVGQAHGLTEFLDAGALMTYDALYDRHLRWRQITARDFALQRRAQRAADRSEIALDLLQKL